RSLPRNAQPGPAKGRSFRFPWDLSLPAKKKAGTQSARTPRDVAPVANQGENQKQYRDNQNACGFQAAYGKLGAWPRIGSRHLRLWLRGAHWDIVAPGDGSGFPKIQLTGSVGLD